MSKERKKYKRDKVQSVKDWTNTKKYKNTNCIFGRNGKKTKKYKHTKCMVLDGFGLFRRSNGSFGIQDWYLGESDTLGCLDVSNSPSSNWQALGPPKQNNQDIVHQLIVS
jgi:hypothetical protein